MSNQLKKEFKHADVQRMRNIITKDFTGSTKSQSGYKRVDEQHEEGEIWEEGGRQWTVKNGLKQNITKLDSLKKAVRVPLACPKCNGSMSYHLSKQVYKINKMCFNCFIDYEAELRKNGLYDDYLMHARKGNLEFFIKGLEQQFQESLSVDDTFVTEHGDIEEWKGNKTKEKALFTEKFGEYLSFLKSKLDQYIFISKEINSFKLDEDNMTQKELLESVLIELSSIKKHMPNGELKVMLKEMKDLKEDVSDLKFTLLNPEDGVIVKTNQNTAFRRKMELGDKDFITRMIDIQELKKWKDGVTKALWIIFGSLAGLIIKVIAELKS